MPNIIQDVFPATVAIADPSLGLLASELSSQPVTKGAAPIMTARVIITDTEIVIARDTGTGPQIVFQQDIEPGSLYRAPKNSKTDSYVTTVDGMHVAFRKDSTCGCGSRLRSWRPFRSAGNV